MNRNTSLAHFSAIAPISALSDDFLIARNLYSFDLRMLFRTLLYIHIVSGSIGLLTGSINMVRRKGDRLHKRLGTYFYFGMVTAAAVSLILAFIRPNTFLFIVGVFTLYMTYTGIRFLKVKQSPFQWTDKLVTVIMAVAGFSFIIYGTILLSDGFELSQDWLSIVLIVFGIISTGYVIQDVQYLWRNAALAKGGLLEHIKRISGAYIASLTAFLVVNVKFLPPVLVWLAPSLVIGLLIRKWVRQYQK